MRVLAKPLLESFVNNNNYLRIFLNAARPLLLRHSNYYKNMGSANCKTFVSSSLPKSSSNTKSVKPEDQEEFVEGVVCTVDDINENEIKSFDLHDEKILLVRQNGMFSALGSKCTHYGAPLSGAALGNGRLRCQWHGACFNLKTGDIEDFPGLDSLPCFQVTINNKDVIVKARKTELDTGKRVKKMTERNEKDAQLIVAIGGGPSSAAFVETLRQEGYRGRIVMVSKENANPYDRVKISKAMDNSIKKIQLRTDEFYNEHGIEVLKGISATAVDTTNKTITLSEGETLQYDRVYIATGCKPFKPPYEGCELENISTLRDFEEANYVFERLNKDVNLIIVGTSFIGMEVASYSMGKVGSITVVGRDNVPLKPIFGEAIGKSIMKFFEEKGIQFKMNCKIQRFIGTDGKVNIVEFDDGTYLKTNLVVMGTGSTFYTEFLENSGIDVDPNRGHIPVNEFLQTNVKEVYAGGDIAYAPIWCCGETNTIGHFPLAQMHGRIAALNILGKKTPLQAVPYFWTTVFGKSFRYAGYGAVYDDVVYAGNVDELKFVAFYLKQDKVVAASSCMMDPIVSKYAELLAQGKQLYRKNLQPDPLAWATSK